jgi:hypothetical protein
MSVATSTCSLASLKSASARVRADWLLLPWIAADGMSCLVEVFGELVGAVLGAGEHQHLEPLVLLDQEGEQFALHLLRAQVHRLGDQLGGGVAAGHLDEAGLCSRPSARALISSEKVAENSRFWRFLGSSARIFLMSRMKPMSSMRSASSSTRISTPERSMVFWVHVVEQAARGGDEDVDLLLEAGDLRVDVDAAEHHHRGERQVLAVGLDRFLDLRGEFARRGEDQAAGAARLDVVGVLFGQDVQDRQREAGGLAGAGLGGGHQVAAGEHLRNGLGLDRGGHGVAGFGANYRALSCPPRKLPAQALPAQ